MENIKTENNIEGEGERAAERVRLLERIYREAMEEHAGFKDVPEADIKTVIKEALSEVEALDRAADAGKALAALTPEVAERITALWDFSGPGTYDQPVKEDRYKNYPWARGMDRSRLNYSAWLVRKISEAVSDEKLRGPIGEAPERKEKARELIAEKGPVILYNGTELENSVVKDVVMREGIMIPPEKIVVMGKGIDSTVDQVRSFKLPEELHRPGGEIGIVSHAPHLMRIAHMLSWYEPLPKDMTVRLFPVPMPTEGKEEYTATEIRALLYYIFLGQNAKAKAYPSVIHGGGKIAN